MEELLMKYFEIFSQKFSGYTCLVKNEIQNFQKLLSKQQDIKALDDWFCWNYVAYQFEYFVGENQTMDGKYPANWIFGPKALKRWNMKSNEHWMYHVQVFLDKYEIQKPITYFSNDMEKQYEQERRRFFNTDYGLFHCQEFAKFFDSSPSCMICKNKNACKKLWK